MRDAGAFMKTQTGILHYNTSYLRYDELFEGKVMEYLIEDIYGVVDKIDGLNEALGYLLLDESELPKDLVAATKRLREQLKYFKCEFTKAQSQEQT